MYRLSFLKRFLLLVILTSSIFMNTLVLNPDVGNVIISPVSQKHNVLKAAQHLVEATKSNNNLMSIRDTARNEDYFTNETDLIVFNVSFVYHSVKLNILYGAGEGSTDYFNTVENKSYIIYSRYYPSYQRYQTIFEFMYNIRNLIFVEDVTYEIALMFNQSVNLTVYMYNYTIGLYQSVEYRINTYSLNLQLNMNLSMWGVSTEFKLKFVVHSNKAFASNIENMSLANKHKLLYGRLYFITPYVPSVNISIRVPDSTEIYFHNLTKFFYYDGIVGSDAVWNYTRRSLFVRCGGFIVVLFRVLDYWNYSDIVHMRVDPRIDNTSVDLSKIRILYQSLKRKYILNTTGFYYLGYVEVINEYPFSLYNVPLKITLEDPWFNFLAVNQNLSDICFVYEWPSGEHEVLRTYLASWNGSKAVFIVNIPILTADNSTIIKVLYGSYNITESHNDTYALRFGNLYRMDNLSNIENWFVPQGSIFIEYYDPPINKTKITYVADDGESIAKAVFNVSLSANFFLSLFIYFMMSDVTHNDNNVTFLICYLDDMRYIYASIVNRSDNYHIEIGIRHYAENYIIKDIDTSSGEFNQVNMNVSVLADKRTIIVNVSSIVTGLFESVEIYDYFGYSQQEWKVGVITKSVYAVSVDYKEILSWLGTKVYAQGLRDFDLNVTLIENGTDYADWKILSSKDIQYYVGGILKLRILDLWGNELGYFEINDTTYKFIDTKNIVIPLRAKALYLQMDDFQEISIISNGFNYTTWSSEELFIGDTIALIVIRDYGINEKYYLILDTSEIEENNFTLNVREYLQLLKGMGPDALYALSAGTVQIKNKNFYVGVINRDILVGVSQELLFSEFADLLIEISKNETAIENELKSNLILYRLLENYSDNDKKPLKVSISISPQNNTLKVVLTYINNTVKVYILNRTYYELLDVIGNLSQKIIIGDLLEFIFGKNISFPIEITYLADRLMINIWSGDHTSYEFWMNITYLCANKTLLLVGNAWASGSGRFNTMINTFNILSILAGIANYSSRSAESIMLSANLEESRIAGTLNNVHFNIDYAIGYLILVGLLHQLQLDYKGTIYLDGSALDGNYTIIVYDPQFNSRLVQEIESTAYDDLLLNVVERKIVIVDYYIGKTVFLPFFGIFINGSEIDPFIGTLITIKGVLNVSVIDKRFNSMIWSEISDSTVLRIYVYLGYLIIFNGFAESLLVNVSLSNESYISVVDSNNSLVIPLVVNFSYHLTVYYENVTIFEEEIVFNSTEARPSMIIVLNDEEQYDGSFGAQNNDTGLGEVFDNTKKNKSETLSKEFVFLVGIAAILVFGLFIARKLYMRHRRKEIVSSEEILRRILSASNEARNDQQS